MARIELHIEADSADDLHETLIRMVNAKIAVTYEDEPAEEPQVAEPAPKRTRRTKKQIAQDTAAAVAGQPGDNADNANEARDAFAEQIRQSAEEPAAESMDEYTKADVQAQLQVFISAKSMPAAREIMEQFQAADGQPVKNLTTLQPKDYAAAYAALQV